MLKIEKIGYDKLETLLELYREKAEWLVSIGQPMWSLELLEKETFIKKYNNPDCFLASIGETPAGGFVLMEKDDFLWEPDSHSGVFYIHKLVVKNGFTGQGNAQKMLNWIDRYAMKAGKEKLRLDCFEDRQYLMSLYESCGFRLVDVKTMPDGIRIAQFEKKL